MRVIPHRISGLPTLLAVRDIRIERGGTTS